MTKLPKALRLAAVCALTGLLLAPMGLDRLPAPPKSSILVGACRIVHHAGRRGATTPEIIAVIVHPVTRLSTAVAMRVSRLAPRLSGSTTAITTISSMIH